MSVQEYSEHSLPIDNLLQQLRAVAAQLRAGMDIPPARRLHLEGMAAAIIANGVDCDWLLKCCAKDSVTSDVTVMRNGDTLQIDCWQQRAPVYPTTSD